MNLKRIGNTSYIFFGNILQLKIFFIYSANLTWIFYFKVLVCITYFVFFYLYIWLCRCITIVSIIYTYSFCSDISRYEVKLYDAVLDWLKHFFTCFPRINHRPKKTKFHTSKCDIAEKTETYNDAAFYPHVDLFIQPDLDPRPLGTGK